LHQSGIFWPGEGFDSSGKAGEVYVALLLEAQRWNILGRNERYIGYELDLVARKGSTLAIVEVKFRKVGFQFLNELTCILPRRKQRSLIRGSRYVITKAGPGIKTIRFDLALVVANPEKQKRPALQPDVFYFPSIFSANG